MHEISVDIKVGQHLSEYVSVVQKPRELVRKRARIQRRRGKGVRTRPEKSQSYRHFAGGPMMALFLVLFDFILYVPSTIFQLNKDGSSWIEPVLS